MIKLNVIGLNEMRRDIKKYSEQLKKDVSGIVENGAKTFVRNAKRDAPVDLGVLRNMITYSQSISDKSRTTFMVHSQARYSPYVEFGTIKYVFFGQPWVDAELMAYATQFKGEGIRKNGSIYPHPFFFPQRGPVKVQIERQVAARLREEKNI